ncbi:hypothetical protein [Paraburkholderia phytofirmans]|uniref:Uncharacterized protein n=1 Tax=Paraburkholderia phytofirmans (strain DSM 17436 / LMG 22146 / PsJN) TaxID=398527 RepID=B2T8Y0_PARPJ|nr:hypothetical protein [Paraburkholderia phytofirmans]ACD20793.1 hypothetical protein Bphyt_6487 [Paraburkholderia phytofirmans PsJN]
MIYRVNALIALRFLILDVALPDTNVLSFDVGLVQIILRLEDTDTAQWFSDKVGETATNVFYREAHRLRKQPTMLVVRDPLNNSDYGAVGMGLAVIERYVRGPDWRRMNVMHSWKSGAGAQNRR